MAKRVYLDSNVFISLNLQEIGGDFSGLFIQAQLFFNQARKNNDVVVVSKLALGEIQKKTSLSEEDIFSYLSEIGVSVELVVFDRDNLEFNRFMKMGIHTADALHIALAIKAKCDCIVTFNIKDFEKAGKYLRAVAPAEFT